MQNIVEKDFSVVIPVYNSASMVADLFAKIDHVFQTDRLGNFEVILVDDGSKDNSWEQIMALKKQFPGQVVGVRLARNFGQHSALMCGFNFASGRFIITMDDDFQHPPEEIPKLIQAQKDNDADIVYGTYKRSDNMMRSYGSWFLRRSSKYVSQTIGEGSSFRLISKHVIEQIRKNHQHHFVFIDEVMQWYTSNIFTIEVAHHPRKKGRSTYTIGKLVRLFLNISINYSAVPLKLMTFGGLIFSIITFLFGMRYVLRRIFYEVPLGYTSIIVSVLFSASIMLFCMGIIGQYMYKMFQMQNKKPLYAINKVLK